MTLLYGIIHEARILSQLANLAELMQALVDRGMVLLFSCTYESFIGEDWQQKTEESGDFKSLVAHLVEAYMQDLKQL